MARLLPILFSLVLLTAVQYCNGQFIYISPVPGSKMHHPETGIILRTGKTIAVKSLKTDLFSISGSVSGIHQLKVKLAMDQKTILIQPSLIFNAGETVTVRIKDGIRNADGSTARGTSFWFQISDELNFQEPGAINDEEDETENTADENSGGLRLACDHLQPFVITSTPGAYNDKPLLYWNYAAAPAISDCWTSTIISSEGDSIFSYYDNKVGFGFTLNDNGYLTYFNSTDNCFDMMDSSYDVVSKFYMGNGYEANKHEFRIYKNGYHFMQCFDQQLVDMSEYGGPAVAEVTGLVIQEMDSNNDVIFQWRSWDHFQYTDAANDISLTSSSVDYVHGNAMEMDGDGNLLVSCRNLDEITKIDLSTGEIIWRLGGKNNQFTFLNDADIPKPFSHQHHLRRLANGHYTLFDNGNFQNPQRSKAKEFVLDQVNKTATLVWSYAHPEINGYDIFSSSLGSVQVFPNGNRLIDWGQIGPNSVFTDLPNFTEVDSNDNIVWEFRFVDSTYVSYRACKVAWDRCNLISDSSLSADSITAISADLHWSNHKKISGFVLEYRQCGFSSWMDMPLDTDFFHLEGLQPNTCYDWRIMSVCQMYSDSFSTLSHQFSTLNPLSTPDPAMAQSSFFIYPNPASGQTALSFSCNIDCSAGIVVSDIAGEEIMNSNIPSKKGINKVALNLNSLMPGVYTIRLILPGVVQYRQLVVQ